MPRITGIIARHRTRLSQLLGIIFLLVYTFSEKKLEQIVSLATETMFLTGCLLVGVATVGRLWCSQYIGGYKSDTLVTDGPYSICRNPLYFFSFLGGIGAGLCTESLTLSVIIATFFVIVYPITIKNEENYLSRNFGRVYRHYVSKVPCFFPKFSLYREPTEYIVNTRAFRREVVDAMYFVWIIGFFEFIEELIKLGMIKTYISFY